MNRIIKLYYENSELSFVNWVQPDPPDSMLTPALALLFMLQYFSYVSFLHCLYMLESGTAADLQVGHICGEDPNPALIVA